MTPAEWAQRLRLWLRDTHAASFAAALEWLWPRCRTEEERALAPALLLLLSPFNAVIAPCRPVIGSRVNFHVTMSRQGSAGPERARITLRTSEGVQKDQPDSPRALRGSAARTAEYQTLWLDADAVLADPVGSAAAVLAALLESAPGGDHAG